MSEFVVSRREAIPFVVAEVGLLATSLSLIAGLAKLDSVEATDYQKQLEDIIKAKNLQAMKLSPLKALNPQLQRQGFEKPLNEDELFAFAQIVKQPAGTKPETAVAFAPYLPITKHDFVPSLFTIMASRVRFIKNEKMGSMGMVEMVFKPDYTVIRHLQRPNVQTGIALSQMDGLVEKVTFTLGSEYYHNVPMRLRS